jgi:hypothetical protein
MPPSTVEEVRVKLTEKSALNYLKMYESSIENLELFPEMLDGILGAPTQEQFENFTLLYIMDMKYPRTDIAMASGIVAREKGFKQS